MLTLVVGLCIVTGLLVALAFLAVFLVYAAAQSEADRGPVETASYQPMAMLTGRAAPASSGASDPHRHDVPIAA